MRTKAKNFRGTTSIRPSPALRTLLWPAVTDLRANGRSRAVLLTEWFSSAKLIRATFSGGDLRKLSAWVSINSTAGFLFCQCSVHLLLTNIKIIPENAG